MLFNRKKSKYLNDDYLISQIRGTEKERSLALIWIRDKSGWFKYARSIVKDDTISISDHQELFLKAIANFCKKILKKEEKGGKLDAFFIGIYKNAARDFIKSKITQKKYFDSSTEEDIALLKENKSNEFLLDRRKYEFAEILDQYFATISEKCQSILKMESLGFSRKENAHKHKLKENQLNSQIRRCRKTLRDKVEGDPIIAQFLMRKK